MRGSVAVCGAVVLLACAPAVASADAGYDATWITQTPPNGTVIESGELVDATMTLRNTGTKPWTRPDTKLGPSGSDASGRDRVSALQGPAWLAPNRIVSVDQDAVAVDDVGTFHFQFRGAPVGVETGFHEIVAPLNDGSSPADAGWMDGSATIPFGFLYYDLVVRPSVPPTVTIDAAPDAVVAGQAVPVTATAADNVRVRAVSARIDGQPVVTFGGDPAQGAVPTTGLAPGAHTLTVAAIDGAGNLGTAQRALQVSADAGLPNGTPAGPATLTAGLSSKRRAKLTAAYGRRVQLGGRLRVAGSKAPVAGAVLQVQTRTAGSRRWRTVEPVSTDRLGRYETRLRTGPSRAIRVVYRASSKADTATAQRTVRVATRAPVRLATRLSGRSLRMTGRLLAGPLPRGGLLVSLQGYQRGRGWREIQTVRASGRRRAFAGRYRFRGGGRFAIRAVVKEQSGYPYARGTSKRRRVSVR